jgi:hypothetical protein
VLFLLEQRNTPESFIVATEALHDHIRAIIQMADNPKGPRLSFDAVSHINRLAGSFPASSKVTNGIGAGRKSDRAQKREEAKRKKSAPASCGYKD